MVIRAKTLMRSFRTVFILLWVVLSTLGAQASSLHPEEASQPTYEVKVEMDVKVPMSDGVQLSTNIFRPDAPGQFPVILIRTPYSNGDEKNSDGQFFAERGYAVVIQDTRGRFESEGEFNPFFNESRDGYDAQEWAGTQPWSNGKIATTGGSYVGYTQWAPAPLANEHLVAMFPVVTFGDFHDVLYIGGAFQFHTFGLWSIAVSAPPEKMSELFQLDWSKLLKHLPLNTLDEKSAGFEVPFLREWLKHPDYDDHWKPVSVRDRYEAIQAPVYNVAGWYDIFSKDSLTEFNNVRYSSGSQIARENQYIIVGPWTHGGPVKNGKIGDVEFGTDAFIDLGTLQLRWFDYWLKGIDTGIEDEPPVRIFVMGENVWRDEQEWPLARTQYTKHYFHSKGNANTLAGDGELTTEPPEDEPQDSYVYDPDDPVPTMGGNNLLPPAGPHDQRPVEGRQDVLVYTGPELTDDVEVTGPISVGLYAATTARDTDFTAKLVDVHPDGSAINLCDGIIRGRYRESSKDPRLLEPGKVYKYTIDLTVTSNVFKKGHRMRVEISSSNFPRFDRNTNTGNTFAEDDQIVPATQTIHHDAGHPSHILLPIIPERE
jgi:putative CocE/NonD family hydrolase